MALGIFWALNITTQMGEGSNLVAVEASRAVVLSTPKAATL